MTISFRIARIPKGRGLYREIYIPSKTDRIELRSLLPQLQEIHERLDDVGASYAFLKSKNCALMALQHIGQRYTLAMDLENFFESVATWHVTGVLPSELVERCFIDGRLRQGFPTSPVISNIAFVPFDRAIVSALQRLSIAAVYTRYADDLVFSYANESIGGKIQTLVRQIVESGGFKVNEGKTRIQSAENGRIIVAGVALDKSGLHATRKTRRKIRAALHQERDSSAIALEEWAKCKLPRSILSNAPKATRHRDPR
jgi:hypothetical protein